VIAIKPYYLYLKDTLFSIAKAASNFSKSQGISGNFADFLALFKEEIIETRFRGTRQKDRRGLRECYPTHEQAEVLVKDCIGFEDFISICFKDESELSEAKQQLITTGRPRKGYPSKEAISKFIVDKQLWLDWATIKES